MTNSKLSEALEQINEIHGHIARGAIYSGFRPLPVALSGLLGFVAAGLQPGFVRDGDPRAFVYYWFCAAGFCAMFAGSAVMVHFFRQTWFERRQILHVWGQFVPCLAAGALVGAGVLHSAPALTGILPGLYAIIFSLGIFSSRPFLPKAIGWVSLFYLIAGAWLLMHPVDLSRPAWPLAWVFFIGQCGGALILYLKLERTGLRDA